MRMRWLARFLLPRLRSWGDGQPPDFQVVRVAPGEGNQPEVYLRRWWIIPRNRWLNLYLHNMLKDDDATLHDHPYWSVSLVLTDGLLEYFKDDPPYEATRSRTPKAGDLVLRSANMAHQLIVLSPAWTLFLTGPRVREWGFWCPQGWRPWTQYVATNQDPSVRGNGLPGGGSSSVGLGCGEQP